MSSNEGAERWLISYADFITLLFVLFVVLWSISNTDAEKFRVVAESLARAFGGSEAELIELGINQSGIGEGEGAPSPVRIADFPPRPPDTFDVATNIGSLLTQAGIASDVAIVNNAEGVLISISERLLFQPGSADIQPTALVVLDQVAAMLQEISNDVRVVAHTDPVPPTDSQYATNWDLSTARAVAIVRYLVEFGSIQPERLIAAGRAEFQPIYPNDTAEHMGFNRRADITIVYFLDQAEISVGIVDEFDPIPDLP